MTRQITPKETLVAITVDPSRNSRRSNKQAGPRPRKALSPRTKAQPSRLSSGPATRHESPAMGIDYCGALVAHCFPSKEERGLSIPSHQNRDNIEKGSGAPPVPQRSLSNVRLLAQRSSERLGRAVSVMDIVLDSDLTSWTSEGAAPPSPALLVSPDSPYAPMHNMATDRDAFCATCSICNDRPLSAEEGGKGLGWGRRAGCSGTEYWATSVSGYRGTTSTDFLRDARIHIPTSAERSTAEWEGESGGGLYDGRSPRWLELLECAGALSRELEEVGGQ